MNTIKASSAPGLHVVLAYGSLAAACRAAECLKAKRQTEFNERTMSLSPWSFEMLESPALFAEAAGNVRHARVLAIAVSEAKQPLSEATEHWLKTCLSRRHRAQLTVAAILGRDDLQAGAARPWFESVQRVVVSAGCAFLAWQATEAAGLLH